MKSKFSAPTFKPIGFVRKGKIWIEKKWIKGLQGVEDFSHIIVLFWLNQAHKPELFIHPRGNEKVPKTGLFATRTPHRPNPIGLTVVKLLKHRGSSLEVEGLDAWDGTPILDIKPYTKKEEIKGYRLPEWIHTLDKAEADPLRKYGSA
jgi:tRNA-Thr(GGU) m(6)t(6)A37 methyltransferase TsaA